MVTRRRFVGQLTGGVASISFISNRAVAGSSAEKSEWPVVISTWNHGVAANQTAWEILSNDGWALDAVEAGVRVTEADPDVLSVGIGGLPDKTGRVSLDACIMDETGRAGSVAFLEHILHPVSVARRVMEVTPHVMLAGKGALDFALEQGFRKTTLLTKKAKAAWKDWQKRDGVFRPVINIENEIERNHDTISMLAIDSQGRLCGACTTSGMAFKMHGRIGDSPIIGAGLFVDGEVGGAAATGSGELVMKTLGSFLVVELMRSGLTPDEACREAVDRIARKIPDHHLHQIGYIALNSRGEVGSFAMQPDFNYALTTSKRNELVDVPSRYNG